MMSDASVQKVLPRWQSHKKIWADQIVGIIEGEALSATDSGVRWMLKEGGYVDVPRVLLARGAPVEGDYYVVYDDGYQSHSPRAAFESGYTRI